MDETTVFNNPTPTTSAPVVTPQPVSQQPPPQNNEGPRSKFSAITIVKLIIGLLAIALISFGIFGLLIPNLTPEKEEGKTITYWGLFEDEEVLRPVIADFESKNPGIKVDYQKQDIKQYREKLETRIRSDTGPDVFRFHNTWVPMLSQSILPLPSDTITVGEFKDSFYPVAQKDLVKNGAIYGIPLEIDTLGLYANSEILNASGVKPPTTWTDFISTARSLTVKDQDGKIKTAGAALGTFDNVTHAPDLISLLFVQNGVDLNNISQNSKKAVDALNFYTSFTLLEGNVWDSTLDKSILAFSQGNLAMYFGYLRDYFTIKELNSNLTFQTALAPQLPEQNITVASYWAEGVSVKSKHQKEALLFIKFLSQKETQSKIYDQQVLSRGLGQIPGRVDLINKISGDTQASPFAQQAKHAASTFFVDGTFDNGINSKLNGFLAETVNSILNGSEPQTAVETLSREVAETFAQLTN